VNSSSPLHKMSLIILVCLFLTATAEFLPSSQVVIGIIGTAGVSRTDPKSYIKVTYPEFAEIGGKDVKVIPIPWNLEQSKFDTLLESINGVLFTGGGAFLWDEDENGKRSYSAFQKRLNYVVEFVKKKKHQGVHYPLWAICQGFEAIAITETTDLNILDNYVHFAKLDKIYFTPEASDSTLFQFFTESSFNFLQENPTMFFWHEYGVNASAPSLYPALSSDNWVVTATGRDENGKEFLAAMESKTYPIYMYMFHGERVLWEANNLPDSKHLSAATVAVKLMAKSFIKEASKNSIKFQNQELLNALIIESFQPNGLTYTFTENSLDERWETVMRKKNEGNSFFTFLVIVIIAAAIYFVYKKYTKKDQEIFPKDNSLNERQIPLQQYS